MNQYFSLAAALTAVTTGQMLGIVAIGLVAVCLVALGIIRKLVEKQ